MLTREQLEGLIFGTEGFRRYTQDSPVLPDVWIAYSENRLQPLDLLLTPTREANPAALSLMLKKRLEQDARGPGEQGPGPGESRNWRLAYNDSYVAAELTFRELIRAALPLSKWWSGYLWETKAGVDVHHLADPTLRKHIADLLEMPLEEGGQRSGPAVASDLLWAIRVIGRILWEHQRPPGVREGEPTPLQLVEAFHALTDGMDTANLPAEPLLWAVSRNRPATLTVWRSRQAIKADAASRVFDLRCQDLRWAVIDSGIDARHPAFRRRNAQGVPYDEPFDKTDGRVINRTRIVATYDFNRIRQYLDLTVDPRAPGSLPAVTREDRERVLELRQGLLAGRAIDWALLEPILRVPEGAYVPPEHEHGTHVAGILAGDWRKNEDNLDDEYDLSGICPDLELYDLRVLDDKGEGNEFTAIAALQFVRYLNAHKDTLLIHGVNISLSIAHDVANYACGRTPVCEECERLVGNGVVVVAAAGNRGWTRYRTPWGDAEAYSSISITDPGNADGVITVGATHRYKPHTYGVSYFSSRGPTGDGRNKPDLVAPGEKIKAPVPHRKTKTMDGTSMAAPHVSGAAALLLARHRELVGQPARVKQILCKTATDLGRERYFQGFGMVDVLRALQSV